MRMRCRIFSSSFKKQKATMADPADLGAGGTQEYPNYADDEGKTIYALHILFAFGADQFISHADSFV